MKGLAACTAIAGVAKASHPRDTDRNRDISSRSLDLSYGSEETSNLPENESNDYEILLQLSILASWWILPCHLMFRNWRWILLQIQTKTVKDSLISYSESVKELVLQQGLQMPVYFGSFRCSRGHCGTMATT